ncbi:hypothetical protein [Micromonospora sp. WMMD1082]|uniref:hypothetical protein n=1 Tax=Micromonospora sp. WMMD1082 TaxID=3016104 RepID=UPI002415C0E8|nr:hypothetical protein [Micromonospora sp. WMMD1082]MDG4793298.1 hypothetical protein [Micromonospora sp. WMMD1082]
MGDSGQAGVDSGEMTPAGSVDVQAYVAAVDNLLLDVPWRRRRELVDDLRTHLRENPEHVAMESPREYAAELRSSAQVVPGGLLSGLRSASWPTPLEWWESVLRGSAIVLVLLVAYDFLATASQAIVGDRMPVTWPGMVDSALRSVYPTPAFGGSQRDGLLFFAPLMVLAGQLTTAVLLSRAPQRRRTLRRLTYLSLAVIALLLGNGALRSIM